jgi:Ran GTPase-activating protein (RanGAP) involved in mRNA processing and transport
LGEISAKLIS